MDNSHDSNEPVAWRWTESNGQSWFYWTTDWEHHDRAKAMGFVIEYAYTTQPPRKPWVGLTDEEMRGLEKHFNAERVRTSDEEYLIIYPGGYWAWQRAIEAKLKEKNA